MWRSANAHLGLLHKALDLAAVIHHHNAILGWVLHLSHQDKRLENSQLCVSAVLTFAIVRLRMAGVFRMKGMATQQHAYKWGSPPG